MQQRLRAYPRAIRFQTFWILGIRRGPIPLMVYWALSRGGEPETFRDVVLPLMLLGMATLQRGFRPFLPELLVLEQCPWRSKQPEVVTLKKRSRLLHKPIGAELLGRFLLVALVVILLLVGLFQSLVALRGVIFDSWEWDWITYWILYPASLWMVACIATLIRFVSYLDARTRWEGWEVWLVVQAELARQFGTETSVSTVDRGPKHPATPRSPGRPPVVAAAAMTAAVDVPVVVPEESAQGTPLASRLPLLFLALVVGAGSGSDVVAHGAVTRQSEIRPEQLPATDWFDSKSQQLQPLKVTTELAEAENRKSGWVPRAKSPSSGSGFFSNWFSGLWGNGWWTFLRIIGWLLLLLIVLVLVYLLAFALTRGQGVLGPSQSLPDGIEVEVDEQMLQQIEHLPSEVRRAAGNLRAEAERLMNLNRFDEAIVMLFGHQLLLLDRSRLLRLARGKTNGRYLRETRAQSPPAAQLFSDTVAAFEASYFGGHRPSIEQFAVLWHGNAKLESAVRPLLEAARS